MHALDVEIVVRPVVAGQGFPHKRLGLRYDRGHDDDDDESSRQKVGRRKFVLSFGHSARLSQEHDLA